MFIERQDNLVPERRRNIHNATRNVESTDDSWHILVLPGVLSPNDGQIALEPILDTLVGGSNNAVTCIGYNEPFDVEGIVEEVSEIIEHNTKNGQKTILFGISVGGIIAAMIACNLIARHKKTSFEQELVDCLGIILVDSPFDGSDIIASEKILSLAQWLTNHFTPSDYFNRTVGAFILKPRGFNLPKREESEEMTDEQFKRMRQTAKENLSNQSFSLWWAQLKLMLNSELNPAALRKFRVFYFACTEKNVTVMQPQAANKWEPYVTTTMQVKSPHCAFLQQPKRWRTALDLGLARVKA